jgi:hypothetical protein
MGVTPTFSKGRGKKSMDEYRSGWMDGGWRMDAWMDGYEYLGMESSSQEVHLCPIIKVKACKVLAPPFVHDPDPFFFWLNLVGGFKK